MFRHNICMAQDFQNIHEYYINDEMNRYFSGVHVAQFLNFFKILLCGSLFVLFRFALALSFLRYTVSDYSFGIFKLFLHYIKPFN